MTPRLQQQQQQQQTLAAAAAAAAAAAVAAAASPKISDQAGGKRGQFFSRTNAADHAGPTITAEGGGAGGVGRGRPTEKEGMEGDCGGEGGGRSSKPKCGANSNIINNSNSSKAGGSRPGGAEYLCNECGLGFGSVPELQMHMARKTAWSNQGLVGCRVSCLVDNREWHEGLVTQVCFFLFFQFFFLLCVSIFSTDISLCSDCFV